MLPFDLHVLGLPPAFTLSQDQTLQLNLLAMGRTPQRIALSVSSKLAKACFNVTWTLDTSVDFRPLRGAHTKHLRTLSRINGLQDLPHPAPQDLSSKGAAHYTTIFTTVNTQRSCADTTNTPSPRIAKIPSFRRGANPSGFADRLEEACNVQISKGARQDDAGRSTHGDLRRASRREVGSRRVFGRQSMAIARALHGDGCATQCVRARESVSIGDQGTRDLVERAIFRRNENAHEPRLHHGRDCPTPFRRMALTRRCAMKAGS